MAAPQDNEYYKDMPPVHPAPGIPGPAAGIGPATGMAPAPTPAPGMAPATGAGPGPSIAPGYSRPIVHISAEELHNLLTRSRIMTTIPKLQKAKHLDSWKFHLLTTLTRQQLQHYILKDIPKPDDPDEHHQ